MIRTTITTLTLTAVATIALAAASPALAAAPSDEPTPTAETTVEARDTTCTIDTDFGSIPCPELDWALGGLFDSVAGSSEPTDVGGISSDAVIDVVGDDPEPPLGTPIEETPGVDEAGGMAEVLGGTDELRDALAEAGIELIEPRTTGDSGASETTTESGGTVETTTTIQAAVNGDQTPTGGNAVFSTTLASSSVAGTRINNGPPDDSIDDAAQSIIDLASAGASVLSFDSMMVALAGVFGILGGLGIMIVVAVAFALGRRNR